MVHALFDSRFGDGRVDSYSSTTAFWAIHSTAEKQNPDTGEWIHISDHSESDFSADLDEIKARFAERDKYKFSPRVGNGWEDGRECAMRWTNMRIVKVHETVLSTYEELVEGDDGNRK